MIMDASKYLESLNKMKFSIVKLESEKGIESAISTLSCVSGVPTIALIVFAMSVFPEHSQLLTEKLESLALFYGYNEVLGLSGEVLWKK